MDFNYSSGFFDYTNSFNNSKKIEMDNSYLSIKDNLITFSVNNVTYKSPGNMISAAQAFQNTIDGLKDQLEFEHDCKYNKKLNRWGEPEPEEPEFPKGKKLLEDIKSPFPIASKKVYVMADLYGSKDSKIVKKLKEEKEHKPFKGIGSLQDSSLKSEGDRYIQTGFPSAIATFHYAFMNHQHLALSPSDLIIMIGQGLATHINENSEKLRHHFVDHKGKVSLSIVNTDVKLDGNSDWAPVFGQFAEEVKKRIKKDVYSVVIDDLSTATATTRVVSEMTLMACMKSYFEYDCGGGCGFPKITLKGTVDDWKKLKEKVDKLNKMNKKDVLELDWWLTHLVPVVDKICEAGIERNVDRKFWANMCTNSDDYGISIKGWINVFLPYMYSRTRGAYKNIALHSNLDENFVFKNGNDPRDFADGITKVPFSFKDEFNVKHPMHCYSGILGTKYDSRNDWLEPGYFWSVYKDA